MTNRIASSHFSSALSAFFFPVSSSTKPSRRTVATPSFSIALCAIVVFFSCASFAQTSPVTINTGSNFGTWSIGEVQAELDASGGDGHNYSWSVTSGSLPPGVALRTDLAPFFSPNASAGVIGVATTPGTYNFNLSVTSGGQTASQTFTIKITALTIQDAYQAPDAFLNVPYSYTYTALNNAGPVTWAVVSGIPPGMSMSSGGVLSGTPTQSGSYNLQIQISDGNSTVFVGRLIVVSDIQITTNGVLPNTTANVPYSATVSASGGTPPYKFTSNNLPGNLVLDQNTGAITGTIPLNPGLYGFNVTASDSKGLSYSKEMSIDVLGQPLTLPSVSIGSASGVLDDGALGTDYYAQILVNAGGTAPFNWTVAGVPLGLYIRFNNLIGSDTVLPGNAEILGRPTQLGNFTVTLTVTDSKGATATQSFPLHISELFQDFNDRFPNGTVGVPYSFTTRVIGGSGPYQLTSSTNNLPNGLTFNGSSFLLSGTPNEAGNIFNIQLHFADSGGHSFTAENYLNIGYSSTGSQTITINNGSDLGTVQLGGFYNFQLSACCVSSYVWGSVGGNLPPGITLSANGLLSGVATTTGTYNFVVQAADANNSANFGLRYFVLRVSPIQNTTQFPLPTGNVGSSYGFNFAASGTTGSPTWTLCSGSYLPPGLTLTSSGANSGRLSGIPTQSGQYRGCVNVSDQAGNTNSIYFDISIYPQGANPPLDLPFGPNLGNVPIGRLYYQLEATGGQPPYHYSLTPGATVIPGMRVQDGQPLPTYFQSTNTGGFLGIITNTGAYSTSIRVTDSTGAVFDQAVNFQVSGLRYASAYNLPDALVNTPYSYAFQFVGGSGSYLFAPNGGLPDGFTVSSSGVLSGTPSTPGSYSLNFVTTDIVTGGRNYFGVVITVDPFAIDTPGILSVATVGVPYSEQLAASGCGSNCTWFLSGGLPGNVSLSSSGLLSGTPSYSGTFNFSAQASGSNGTVRKNFSWVVLNSSLGVPFIAMNPNLGTATFGDVQSYELSAQSGTPPYVWSVTGGALPSGMSLQANAETISSNNSPGYTLLTGPPLSLGTFNFTLTVTDANNHSASQAFTLNVVPVGVEYYNLPLPGSSLVYNTPYSQALLAVGGDGNYTWSDIDPLQGLNLSSSGVVSGTATSTGQYFDQIGFNDGQGNHFQYYLGLNIASGTPSALTFNSGPNLGIYQQGFQPNIPLNPAGGVGPYTINVMSPLPPGLVLLTNSNQPVTGVAASNFILTGSPMAAGTFSFTVQIQDTQGNIGARTFFLTIAPFTLFNNLSLADGSVGVSYSVPLVAFDNSGTPFWAVAPGSILPPGLSLSSGGLISGTPTQAGQFSFQVAASDGGATITYSASVHISSLSIQDAEVLPNALLGIPYNYPFAASGTPGITWSATGLPAGLQISSSGVITGTAVSAGRNSVFVTAATSTDHVREHFLLYVIPPNPTELSMPAGNSASGILGQNLPGAVVGQNYQFALIPSGGVPPYAFSLAAGSTLPGGLSLYSGAQLQSIQDSRVPGVTVLAGVPTTAGNYSFTLVLTDVLGHQTSALYSLNVSALSVIPTSVPNGISGVPYSQQFTVVGGTAPYTFSVTPTDLFTLTLPAGLTISSSGLLSGTSPDTGDFSFVLHVQDATGNTFASTYSFSFTNQNNLQVTVGRLYDDWIGSGEGICLSTNGNSTYTWSVVSGALPPGMFAKGDNADCGQNGWILGGAPSVAATYGFRLRATDNGNPNNFADQTLTLRVAPFQRTFPGFTLLSNNEVLNPLPTATVGSPYSATLKFAGGTAPYTVTESNFYPLPPGLTLSADGVLSGTAQASGQFVLTPVVTDANGNTANGFQMELIVISSGNPVPLVSGFYPNGSDQASIGTPYIVDLDALFAWHRGSATQTWSVAPNSILPPGLALALGSNGLPTYLAGIPTTAGNYPFQLTATDGLGQSLTFNISLAVTALAMNPEYLPPGIVGTLYSAPPLVPSGGVAPYTVTLAPYSDMPPGLTFDSGSDTLSGTPTSSGAFFLAFNGSDTAGNSIQKSYEVIVDNAAVGDAPALTVGPNSSNPIVLLYTLGSQSPISVPVNIVSTSGAYPFTLAESGLAGATLSANSGTTSASVNLSIDTSGYQVGTYVGIIGAAAPQTVNQYDATPLIFTVVPQTVCTYVLTPSSYTTGSAATPSTFDISTASTCSYTATVSDPTWISINNGCSSGSSCSTYNGTGSGTISYQLAANATGIQRTGTISVNGQLFTITQLATASSQPGGGTSIPSGLTNWYRAEGNALDTQGNANGTLNNGAGFTTGKVGQAFSFNAATQSNVTLPAPVGNFGTNDFTVDFWLNTTQAESFGNPITLMGNRVDCSDGNFFSVRMYSGNSLFVELDQDANHTNYNSVQASSGLNDGNWHHVAIVRQGTTLMVYLDGTPVGTSSSSATTNITGANPFVLGSSPCASSYTGALDEIHIFNRALAQSEVQSIYSAASAGLSTLVGWWRFDEGSGSTTADSSGNGNTGNLLGSTLPQWTTDVPPVTFADPSSLSFDGSTSYVEVPNGATGSSLNFTTQVTVAAWVKPSSVPQDTHGIISKPRNVNGTGWALRMELGVPNFGLNNALVNCSVHASSNPFTPGVWTHVAATYDSSTSTVQLYVNGVNVPVDNQGCAGPLVVSGDPLEIGQEFVGNGSGREFPGEIDEARVYNRILSSAEIAALPNMGSSIAAVASPNPAIYGQAITLTAHVIGDGSPATDGQVNFFDDQTEVQYGVAPVQNGTATLTGVVLPAGTHVIVASYSGSATIPNAATKFVVTVRPAVLTVTPDSQSMTYGGVLPTLTATITGFVNGDTASVVTGAAALSTPVASLTPAGTYPIFAAQGTLATSPNYTLAFAVGTFTISPLASVTLPATPNGGTLLAGPSTVETYITPSGVSQDGWITTWQTEFEGSAPGAQAVVPAGVQLKIFRATSTGFQVVAEGAVHDPRPILQQKFGANYPNFTPQQSLTTFTEAPIPVLAGDLVGITIIADSTSSSTGFQYPLLAESGGYLANHNVLLGQIVGSANQDFGATPSVPPLAFTFFSKSASNPLNLMNNFFVTGDYSVGGVSLRGTGVGGTATGTISIPTASQDPTNGIPDGADLVGAFLYWETLENTPSPSANNGTFRGYSVSGQQVGNDVQYNDGTSGTLRVYRADVLPYFALTNGIRVASGSHTVTFPDSGGSGLPLTEGASLVVIYRVMSPNFPLKAVVLYDGSAVPTSSNLLQVVQGFYDAANSSGSPVARTTNIYSSGGTWNTSTTALALPGGSQYAATLTPGAWGAVVLSTPVNSSDNDGILDGWKTGPPSGDFHAGQPGYYDVKQGQWIPLPGAAHGQRDLFVQMDYMCSNVLANGTCDPAGRSELPVTDPQGHDPMLMLQQVFANHGIALHLQLGNAIQAETCTDNLTTNPPQLCQFPNEPGVANWKLGEEIAKVWPRNPSSCIAGGDCSPRFPYGAKDSYHYVLMADSLAIPEWNTTWATLTGITVNNGVTTISTTDRGNGVLACPSRISITGALGNPALNGVYNVTACADTRTMSIATPKVSNWTYPNGTMPEPVLGVTSGTISSISGFSDLGGSDTVVSLGKWETSPNQDMSKHVNVQVGTILHEIGHTLGLSHGGTYFDTPGSYRPTVEANCKPNYQSVMNYMFQIDLLGPNHVLELSNQQLLTLDESQAGSYANFGSPTYPTSAWYVPSSTNPTVSPATFHCDGTAVVPGISMYRVDAAVDGSAPLGWTNNQDINYDGQLNTTMRGYNDWANVDLRQVGATSGQLVELADLLQFGNIGSPLNVGAGGNVSLGSGGTVTLASGGSVTLGSGGSASLSTGGMITLGSGGSVTLGGSGTVALSTGGTITMGSGGNVVLGSAGNFVLGSGGLITMGSGGNVTLGSGGNVTLGSGGTVLLGSGGTVVLGAGGTYTLDSSGGTIVLGAGGNVTLGSGGNVTLGNGGTVTLGSGGSMILSSGGTFALGSGGTISLGSGGNVTLGSGGNVTLGSGGTITLGSGGNVTLGSGGTVALGSGGTVTLGSGGNAALGSGGNVALGSGGTVALGSGGNVTLGSGGTVTLGSGGNIALGSGGTVTLGSGGNVTLGSGGTVALGSGGNVTLGSGGTVTLGSGGNVTLGSGGNVTLGSGGTITLGAGGSFTGSAGDVITLGAGGNVTLGSGGTIALGSGGNVTLGSGGTITLGSGGNVTLGSGGTVTLGSGGTVTLGSGGNVTLGSGGNVTLGSGGNVTLGSGGTIALGSGGNVTLGSGGNVTLGSGGNTILGSGGNVTLGSGGTIALGSGGNVTLGSGGTLALGSGGNIALGSGGNVTLGSGGNIALGSGGTIALGSGGVTTGGSEGGAALGSGGAVVGEINYETANSIVRPPDSPTVAPTNVNGAPAVLVNWTAPSFGVVTEYTIYRSENGGTPVAIGTVSGNPPATTFIDPNPSGAKMVAYTISTGVTDPNTTTTRQSPPSVPALMSQTISFSPIASAKVGDSMPISAAASSGLPVNFSTSGACVLSGPTTSPSTVSAMTVGSCTVTAAQTGNTTFAAANSVSQTFSIAAASTRKLNQVISFAPLATHTYGDPNFTLLARASSNLPVSYAASGSCMVNGSTLQITGSGSCAVTASQSGNNDYNAAGNVSQSFTINPANQTISFPALAPQTYGNPSFAPNASATSGLAVTFSVSGNCSTNGTLVSIAGAGSCTVTASQSGNGNYNPAANVSQSFPIMKALLTVSADNKTKLLNIANPTFTATYSGFKNGETLTTSGVTGAPSLTTTATKTSPVGTYTITAAAGTLAANNYSFAFNNGTLTILYASTGTCDGAPGHAILPPINADGTSVFKQGRTVPVQFRVCDGNGVSIGTAGVVTSFLLTGTYNGTLTTVDDTVDATNNDTVFRWDSGNQQWIFNLSTNNLSAGQTYIFTVKLNDGTVVSGTTFAPPGTASFQFGLR